MCKAISKFLQIFCRHSYNNFDNEMTTAAPVTVRRKASVVITLSALRPREVRQAGGSFICQIITKVTHYQWLKLVLFSAIALVGITTVHAHFDPVLVQFAP